MYHHLLGVPSVGGPQSYHDTKEAKPMETSSNYTSITYHYLKVGRKDKHVTTPHSRKSTLRQEASKKYYLLPPTLTTISIPNSKRSRSISYNFCSKSPNEKPHTIRSKLSSQSSMSNPIVTPYQQQRILTPRT